MAKKDNRFPMTKMQFLWENTKGFHFIYVLAILGTLAYNALQIAVPYFSSQIVDNFLSGEEAASNLANHRDWFYSLIVVIIPVCIYAAKYIHGIVVQILYDNKRLFEIVSYC